MSGDTTEKARLSEASNQRDSSVSVVAHRYGIWPSLLPSWKRRMLEGGHEAVQADEDIVESVRLVRRVRNFGRRTGSVESSERC
jgi:transposase